MDSETKKTVKKKRPVLQKTGRALPSSKKSKALQKTDDSYDHIPDEEEDDRDRYMTLGDHLEELRKRIISAALVLLTFSIGVGIYSSEIHDFLTEPFFHLDFSSLSPDGGKTQVKPLLTLGNFYGPLDVMINLSITIGFILALPVVLYIFWGFVTPAISRKAATIGKVIVATSSLLFWSGAYFCWEFVFPVSVQYMLIGMMPSGTMPWISLEKYYSFLLMMHAGLGLLFQLPLLFIILGALGILPLSWHKKVWKYMLVGLTLLAALLTPPDVVSQILFMIPISVLYAISMIIVWIIERGKRSVSDDIE